MDLDNETVVNVAALLKEPVGSTRTYGLTLDSFELDHELLARDIHGSVKLTRLSDEVMAAIAAEGEVELQCFRCLLEYSQPFATTFVEGFRIAHDVRTGNGIAPPPGDERFEISQIHELDFGETLRQEIIVALPMRPTCGPDCPGPDVTEVGETERTDERFAALAQLLDEGTED
jgi:uncharacterized protein